MSGPSTSRRGFSLAELMVVLVLIGIVGGAIMNVIVRQQRFYRATDEVIGVRTRLRDATTILPVDLRAVSPHQEGGQAGDILHVTSNSIAFRATYGASVACAVAGTAITIPPTGTLSGGTAYTAWITQPQVGDSVALYNAAGNTWTLAQITGFSPAAAGTCPAGGAGFFRRAGDPEGFTMNVSTVGAGVTVGSPIRFLNRVRYGLYRAEDGRYYLGFGFVADREGFAWAPQPVSGPFTENGLTIACTDTLGAAVAVADCENNGAVGQLTFVFRSETNAAVTKSGVGTQAKYLDSMVIRVALRNNT